MDVYIFVLGIIIGILLVVYFIPRSWFRKIQESTLVGPLSLEKKPQIGKTEDSQLLLSATNTGSFQAFVYPLPLQRTGEEGGGRAVLRRGQDILRRALSRRARHRRKIRARRLLAGP